MPVTEPDVFADLVPGNLIGGESGAPAFQQDTTGDWSEVPRAQLNSLPAPDVDAFSDLVPTTDLGGNSSKLVDAGLFSDLIPKPYSETEAALAETPVYNPKNEQIRAAPTFFGELHAGRLGSAYYLAKEAIAEQFKGQPIEKGRGGGLLGTTEQIPASPDDSLPIRAAKAFVNVSNRTMAGLTTPEMIPLAVIGGGGGAAGKLIAGAFAGDIARHAPETWQAIQEAETTSPWSQERFEAGLDTVMQGLMMSGAARHAARREPVRPVSESEAPPATTERQVEQTLQSDNPAQRMVPIEEIAKGERLTPIQEEVTLPDATSREPNQFQERSEQTSFSSAEASGYIAQPLRQRAIETAYAWQESFRRNDQEASRNAATELDRLALEGEKLQQSDVLDDINRIGSAIRTPSSSGENVRQTVTEVRARASQERQRLGQQASESASPAVSRPYQTARETSEGGDINGTLSQRSPKSEIPRTIEAGENQPGSGRETRPGESVDTSEARAAEVPAAKPETVAAEAGKKTRIDLILDEVEKSGEVTIHLEGSTATREMVQKVQAAAEARGMTAGYDGAGFLIRKNPVAEIPENLRRSPEIDRLINEPEAQTGPQMKMAAPTEGGALGFAGGKRATVAPKGTTPRGDTEFLRIEPGYKRIFKGLERKGAADVLGETKNKVGKLLSDATRKHVDIEQELFGRISTELIRPIKSVPKKVAAKAFDEVAGYLAAKENGRPLPTISPTAQNLVTAWENIADKTGKIAAANGVQVFDPALNASRPMHTIGRQYVPRMFKAEVEQVLRDPTSNPRLWNDLVTDFAAQRKIPEADAANQLTREAGKFSSNDFMGNLEMARAGKMPESFYEYDLRNITARYIPNFSERMAQIISYGQRLGPRENPTRPDLWDIARKESRDPYTQDWLNSAENQAVNLKLKGTAATGMARAQTAASGLLLSSPTTTVMRNLISGVSATPELLGVRRSLKGFADTIRKSQTRMDAREIGTVRDNIADFLHADRLGDSPVDNAIRSVVDAGLKYSGYNGSEVFVRTHGTVTAAQFAKDAVAAIQQKPGSMRSKEALGLFQRMGVDAAKIVAEKADWKTGPETRKFIRTVIRDTQGGYRFDQVPLWANSNMGRFFYQFGRWGTQRARNIWKNGIQPALGEEVQWHGKTMTRRDIRPLAKMLAGTVVLGETFAGIAQVLFGRDRRDASLSEISAAWNEDEKKAVGLAMQRMTNDLIMAGTLGIWSQPVDWGVKLKDQSRLKNPTEPPGLGSLKAFVELGQNMLDQGGELTRRDLWKFTAALAPGVKQMGDVARNVMDEPLYEAENDVRTLRGAAHRWGEQAGLDVSPRNRGDFRKSALAPEYEPIKEALLVGDSQRAKFLSSVFLDSQKDKDKARQNLKMSIKMSQPFRAGPYTAKVHRDNFREWAKKNLSEDDYQQAERIQARYQKAAIAANLW